MGDRPKGADQLAESRRRTQPAGVSRPEKSNLWRSNVRSAVVRKIWQVTVANSLFATRMFIGAAIVVG
jgi:hypothetical protein